MFNLLTKIVVLCILLIGIEKQVLVAYHTINPKKDIAKTIESFAPAPVKPNVVQTNRTIEIASCKPQAQIQSSKAVCSVNVIMVWYEKNSNQPKHHILNTKQFEVLERIARSLPLDKFNDLVERGKQMSTDNFIAFLQEKENELVASPQIATLN